MSDTNQLSVQEAHAVFSTHAKSFRLASLFLPKDSVDDIALLYALCRMIDDAVDEAPSEQIARENIAELQSELLGEKEARTEIRHFFRLQEKWGLEQRDLLDLIQGMKDDLGAVRIETDQELTTYCYRVAGVVGKMMSPLLGVQDPAAEIFAIDLGLAMQLTNICRDVREDIDRDRIYLPASRLRMQGVEEEALFSQKSSSENLACVVRDLLDIADVHYRRAYIGTQYIPWKSRLGIVIALRVYRAIGVKLRNRHGANPMHGRTIVSMGGKIWNIVLAGIDFCRTLFRPIPLSAVPEPVMYPSCDALLEVVCDVSRG